MKSVDITFARIYVMEAEHVLKSIIHHLKNEAKIRGVSVFRAISGFGPSGDYTSAWIDTGLNLPLAIEFFDQKDKVMLAIDHLSQTIKPEHIVFWDAQANI